MSFRHSQIAMVGLMAAAAAVDPLMTAPPKKTVQNPDPQPERVARGNSSGHMPHQGKREMERRRKRLMREPEA